MRLQWILLVAVLALLTRVSEPPTKTKAGPHMPPVLPRPELVQVLGAPIENLVADYFWIQTVHATGIARTPAEYRDVYDYANLVVTIDPDFEYVYTFGGASIPFNQGRERWLNTEESTDLLERGVARFPNNVMMRIMLAYNYSYFFGKNRHAAEVLQATVNLPGAPRYLSALATRLYASGGDVDSGIALAQSLASATDDPATREAFKQRVLELELEKVLQQVDAASLRFRAREARLPTGIDELVRAGDLAEVPDDPLGGTIDVDWQGQGYSTAQQRRLRVFDPTRR